MTEYTWQILKLHTIPHENGLDNVVKKVDWRFIATDGDYYGDSYEVTQFVSPSPDNYIEYENISQEKIVEWILLNRDYDDLVSLVNMRLDENKAPQPIVTPAPWEVSDSNEYLIVIDDDVSNIAGPFVWNRTKLNDAIAKKGIEDVSVPNDGTMISDNLFPVNNPLVISNRVKIYSVTKEPFPNDFDTFLQYVQGPTWNISTGKAVLSYSLVNKTINEIKSMLRNLVSESTFQSLSENYSFTLNGNEYNVSVDDNSYITTSLRASSMNETDVVNWKLSDNNWISTDKDDLTSIVDFIDQKRQEVFDAEYDRVQEIESSTTAEELKTLYNLYTGE